MKYHAITKDDLLNGSGLRTTLFVSGCSHRCNACHNPETWSHNSGELFDDSAKDELFNHLSKSYISGITLSGGDPLSKYNIREILELIQEIKKEFPTKNIWLYTGYTWEEIFEERTEEDPEEHDFAIRQDIVKLCDVIVDGKFIKKLADVNYPWAGSTNQRVIDIKKTLNEKEIVLFKN